MSVSVLPMIGGAAQAKVDPSAMVHDWERTVTEDTAEAYTRYILENPDGEHRDEALARIEMLGDSPVRVAAAIRHSDLPGLIDGAGLGAGGPERLMNI